MRVAIYHRRARLESEEDSNIQLITTRDWALGKKYNIFKTYFDTADKLDEQLQLKELIEDAKEGRFQMVVCFSPITFSNCSWANFLNLLTLLTHTCGIKFVSWLGVEVNQVIAMLQVWEDYKIAEHKQRMEHRAITEQGGRPPKHFDIEEATRLRVEERLTYMQIGERMKVSAGLIYKRLPKSTRGTIPRELRVRLRRQERERRNLERQKEKEANKKERMQ